MMLAMKAKSGKSVFPNMILSFFIFPSDVYCDELVPRESGARELHKEGEVIHEPLHGQCSPLRLRSVCEAIRDIGAEIPEDHGS